MAPNSWRQKGGCTPKVLGSIPELKESYILTIFTDIYFHQWNPETTLRAEVHLRKYRW
jgi:hypothetical protein